MGQIESRDITKRAVATDEYGTPVGNMSEDKADPNLPQPGDTCPKCNQETLVSVDDESEAPWYKGGPIAECPRCGYVVNFKEARRKTSTNWTLEGLPIEDGFNLQAEVEDENDSWPFFDQAEYLQTRGL